MKNYRIDSKLKKSLKDWRKSITQEIEEISDEFTHIVGQLFVDKARANLALHGYNTEKYTGNIYYNRALKQVIVRGTPEEPDIMWYLEFGTGIAGKKDPHKKASEIGWQYAIKENTVDQKGSAWRTNSRHPDGKGWWVSTDGRGFVYHAENDRLGYSQPHFFTSGIPPVRYLYDTMSEPSMKQIIEEAKQILNAGRK